MAITVNTIRVYNSDKTQFKDIKIRNKNLLARYEEREYFRKYYLINGAELYQAMLNVDDFFPFLNDIGDIQYCGNCKMTLNNITYPLGNNGTYRKVFSVSFEEPQQYLYNYDITREWIDGLTNTRIPFKLAIALNNYGINNDDLTIQAVWNTSGYTGNIYITFLNYIDKEVNVTEDYYPYSRQGNPPLTYYQGYIRDSRMYNDYITTLGNVAIGEDYGNTSTIGGQDGIYNEDSDTIIDDYLPSVSAVSSGIVKMYALNISQLNAFSNYLFSAPTEFIEHLKKLFIEPMQSVIQLSLTNVTPVSTTSNIVICGRDTNVSASKVLEQYLILDCGTITINKKYGNSLDYTPYTKVSLFLPCVGNVQINTDDVMGKTMGIKYKIDLLTGACVVNISIDGSIMYSYQGSCTSQIPITSSNAQQLYNSVVSLIVSGTTAVATNGVSAIASTVASGLNVMGSKENISRGGGIGGSSSVLSVKKPYLTITRPIQSLPVNFKHFKGYTSNITKKISELQGYTEIEYIDLNTLNCTKSEKENLENILKSGFYI